MARILIVKLSQFNPLVIPDMGYRLTDFQTNGLCSDWRGPGLLDDRLLIEEVDESETPSIAEVWLREDEQGILYTWKVNYDTSG